MSKIADTQDGALAAALSTPWRLTLATTVYEEALEDDQIPGSDARALPVNPAELVKHTGDMDEHLLRDYVRAATMSSPSPKRRLRPYRHQDVERWLRELALYLEGNLRTARTSGGKVLSGTDIVLHELWPLAGDTRPRRVDTALAAVMSVPGFIWLAAFAFSHSLFWRVLYFPVLVGYAAALWRPSSKFWIAPRPFDFRQVFTWRGLTQLAVAAGVGAIVALLFNPAAGAVVGFGGWVAGGLSITPTQGLVTTRIPVSSPGSPLRRDLALSMASALSVAPALGLAFSLYFGTAAGWACGMAYAVLVGLTVAAAPWRRYLALLLCTRGKIPWRLCRFLEWATAAGLLRTSGIAYQFRHDELQSWLAVDPLTRN